MIRDTSAQDRPLERRTPRRRRLIQIGTAIAGLVLLVLVAPWFLRMLSAEASVSRSRLAFATVERGPFVRDIAAEGRVVAAVSPTLYAPSAGASELKVHAGESVSAGQVLAVITSPELANRLAQERSGLDAMEVDYQRARIDARKQHLELQKAYDNAQIDEKAAERELDRSRRAFEKGALPQMDVARAEDTLEKARIALEHAARDRSLDDDSLEFEIEAKKLARDRQALLVQDLERQVDELQVRSPVSGQVGQLFVAPRATVARDAELLTVIDLSALEVEVKVPESFARDLAVGMSASIAGNGNTWQGAVSALSPEVVNGEVAARVRFEGAKPENLRQNQRLSVRILLDQRDDVLTVQRGSFADESGGRHAYVVRDGVAVKQPIRIGARSIDKIEILDGLREGDRIVISGADGFGDAARVAISN